MQEVFSQLMLVIHLHLQWPCHLFHIFIHKLSQNDRVLDRHSQETLSGNRKQHICRGKQNNVQILSDENDLYIVLSKPFTDNLLQNNKDTKHQLICLIIK